MNSFPHFHLCRLIARQARAASQQFPRPASSDAGQGAKAGSRASADFVNEFSPIRVGLMNRPGGKNGGPSKGWLKVCGMFV